MSGLEVVGIVASIVQIADLGARISVKLCSFYRTVKDANQSMQSLSSDVSLTCSVLKELGNTLKQDEKAKLYSPEAFKTAQEVLSECKSVFEGIDGAMEEEKRESAKNVLLQRARKLAVAFMGPNLDVLKSNLERLKSTMMLMLHVIMYAGQIRQQKDKASLGDQQGLITALMEDKRASDAKFQQLTKSIEGVSLDAAASTDRSIPQDRNVPIDESIQVLAAQELGPTNKVDNELDKYYGLVCKLLQEIDVCQEFLEKTRHSRMRNGVLSLHSTETAIMKHTHGDQSVCSYEEAFAFALSRRLASRRGRRHRKTHRKDRENPLSSPFSSSLNRNDGPTPGIGDAQPDTGAINPEISDEELPPFHPERFKYPQGQDDVPTAGVGKRRQTRYRDEVLRSFMGPDHSDFDVLDTEPLMRHEGFLRPKTPRAAGRPSNLEATHENTDERVRKLMRHVVDDDKETQNERAQLRREASDALYDTAIPLASTAALVLSDRERRKIADAENQWQQMEYDHRPKPTRVRIKRRVRRNLNRRTNRTEPLMERKQNTTDHDRRGEVPHHKGLGPKKSHASSASDSSGSFNQNVSPLFTDVDFIGQDEWPSLFHDGAASNVFDVDAGSFNATAAHTELKKGASVERTLSMRIRGLPRQNRQSMRSVERSTSMRPIRQMLIVPSDDDSQVENPWSWLEEGRKMKSAPSVIDYIVDQDTGSIPGGCNTKNDERYNVPDPKNKPAPAPADQVSKHPGSHMSGNSLSTEVLLGSLDGLILRWTTLSVDEISSL